MPQTVGEVKKKNIYIFGEGSTCLVILQQLHLLTANQVREVFKVSVLQIRNEQLGESGWGLAS